MQDEILITYYSQSGNTKRIAEIIQRETNGELYEIVPKKAYKSLYLGGGTRIKQERENKILPELCTPFPEIAQYRTIFLGTPNWGNSLAHPIFTFLKQCDPDEKNIVPFCTHGGGGAGHIEADIKKLCPKSRINRIFETYGSGGFHAEEEVRKWLQDVVY